MLKVISLNKSFGNFHVLKDININAEKGQIYGLVGSNGCGKTTLLKHIIQVYQQDSGEIYFEGTPITKKVFPHGSTVKSQFDYEKLLYKKMSKEKLDKLIDFFKIDENKRISTMSKGQKRQAAFVLAMAANPKVLLLDEIVDGLDAVVRRKFWNVLIKEVVEQDITVIISSHALKELDNICDKVGIMHEGVVIKEERMETLKENLKRVQFAVEGDYKENNGDNPNIVKLIKIGSVYFATVSGNLDEFKKTLETKYKLLIFDELPINLEEIFITELGGAGYGMEELDA